MNEKVIKKVLFLGGRKKQSGDKDRVWETGKYKTSFILNFTHK